MKPESTMSLIRPSMIALVSTTIRGSPLAADPAPSGCGRRNSPIACAARMRSSRFATVSPSIPSPRKSETPKGSQVPNGTGKARSGRPSRRPMRRPRIRPTTAVTNSAVDSCSIWRISQIAGTTVRYGRIAKPTTTQATTQAARRTPPFGDSSNRRADAASVSPTRPPRAAPSSRMLRITIPSRRRSRGGGATAPRGRRSRRTLASRRGGRHARGALSGTRQGGLDRVSERPDRDDFEVRLRRRHSAADRSRNDRPIEPEAGGLAEPALEAGDRAELSEQSNLPDRDRPGRDGAIAERGREGEGDRQVESGLIDGQAAGEVHVDIVTRETDRR